MTAAVLARMLDVTPAGIRRHLTALTDAGLITVHDVPELGERGRGRPARSFVVTVEGQQSLASGYRDLATEALAYLEALDEAEVARFAQARMAALADSVEPALQVDEISARVEILAEELTKAGYAATVRPVPGTVMVQLCQGHCPIQAVAAEFPQLCEAETAAFSRLLGVHVQRLSTMAAGGHVCTTNVPTGLVTKGSP